MDEIASLKRFNLTISKIGVVNVTKVYHRFKSFANEGMREHNHILKPTQCRLTAGAGIFRPFFKGFAVLAVAGLMGFGTYADEFPKSLQDAVAKVQTKEAEKAFGVLSRYAYTDNSEQRLAARTALAQLDREAGRFDRALSWVKEYEYPIPENMNWPQIKAFLEATKVQFALGRTFEAVKLLNDAKEKTIGLPQIIVLRTLSEVSQKQPDLKKALTFEKNALKYGVEYFKRKKISETAGYEPPKEGHELWVEWKLEIETRIAELERLLRVETYGLDYVLYEEAQQIRKADHPLALDFTNVAAAFDEKNSKPGVRIPGADFELAVQRYDDLIEFFPGNPYAQAAGLYRAVCLMHLGETDQAIKMLKDFYKKDPTGLYRGEALKLLGDIYLFNRWDQTNAREAYTRSVDWLETTKTRTRILQTYLTPEKSEKISQPPRTIKILTKEGLIQDIPVPENALVNRITSEWYLDDLRTEVEWRLGFIGILNDDWDSAFKHFDFALAHDEVIRKANENSYFNPYHRLTIAKKHKAMVARSDQLKGLTRKEKNVMQWADFQFMLGDFERSLSNYLEIEKFSSMGNRENVYTRAVLGEILVKGQLKQVNKMQDVERLHNLVLKFPISPSAPALLQECAKLTDGYPLDRMDYLKWIYTSYPENDYAVSSRYYSIIHGLDWDAHELRKKQINAFIKDFPNKEGYINALSRLDSDLLKRE